MNLISRSRDRFVIHWHRSHCLNKGVCVFKKKKQNQGISLRDTVLQAHGQLTALGSPGAQSLILAATLFFIFESWAQLLILVTAQTSMSF